MGLGGTGEGRGTIDETFLWTWLTVDAIVIVESVFAIETSGTIFAALLAIQNGARTIRFVAGLLLGRGGIIQAALGKTRGGLITGAGASIAWCRAGRPWCPLRRHTARAVIADFLLDLCDGIVAARCLGVFAIVVIVKRQLKNVGFCSDKLVGKGFGFTLGFEKSPCTIHGDCNLIGHDSTKSFIEGGCK